MGIDLTTVSRVRTFLGASDSSQDTEIGYLIRMYSARVEKFLGRGIETLSRSEQYDLEDGQRVVTLRSYPVIEIDSVKNDSNRVFDDGSLVDADDYDVKLGRGVLEFDWVTPIPGPGVLQVVYTAGMTDVGATDPTASFIENHPDLAMAADMQIAETIRRRARLGASNLSFSGGSVGYEAAIKLLPEVSAILDSHRRVFAR